MENKTSKYFKYAIGEIILVVIGILIALQINTWKEEYQQKREAITILNNLKFDLKEDLLDIDNRILWLQDKKDKSRFLLDLLQNADNLEAIDSGYVVKSLLRAAFITKFVPSFAAYNEIQNTGKLGLIKSGKLKNMLASYKSQTGENMHVETPYESTLKIFERKAISYLSDVPVNVNVSANIPEQLRTLKFNLSDMATDKELMNLLKHINYHTGVEITLKTNLLRPQIKQLLNLIDQELKQ